MKIEIRIGWAEANLKSLKQDYERYSSIENRKKRIVRAEKRLKELKTKQLLGITDE